MPMTYYIAGRMTGLHDNGFAAFAAAEERLRAEGHAVVNPARNFGGRTDLPRPDYIRRDIEQLLVCDAIAMLPGWERRWLAMEGERAGQWRESFARVEHTLARELGLKVRYL
jgi:hypothetical protein